MKKTDAECDSASGQRRLELSDHLASRTSPKAVVDGLINVLGDCANTSVTHGELAYANVRSGHAFVITVDLVRSKLSFEQNHVTVIIRWIRYFSGRTAPRRFERRMAV